jgi:hypothetical protein
METELIVAPDHRELTPVIWQMINQMAPVMYQSRLFGVSSPEQAAAIMLKGYELGMSITASFEFIHVIQGKPGLSPRGALAMLHNHPDIQLKITRLVNDKGMFTGFECWMKRISSGFEYTARFTMADAGQADLIKLNSGWTHYPENMCMWRSVGFCADVVAPDITGGMTNILKMPEKLGVEFSETGEVINGTISDPKHTLDDLVNQFGVDAIMAAGMPSTQDEIDALWVMLENTKETK